MASASRRYPVATADEIPSGGRKLVTVEGRSIGVFNVDGEYFAVRNRCPHEGGPLCAGPTTMHVVSERPGHYEWTRAGEILRCPWHGWEFDLRTGECWFDPTGVRVRRYEVGVSPGSAIAPPQPPVNAGDVRAEDEPAQDGRSYVAETYTVSVDEEYVVLEMG